MQIHNINMTCPRHYSAILEHILSYGHACASCIYDFLSNPSILIFVYWPFILVFLPMESSFKNTTPLRTSACYETKIHCQSPAPPRGRWRLNTHQQLGNSMQFLPQSPFWLKPLKPSLSAKETFLRLWPCFCMPLLVWPFYTLWSKAWRARMFGQCLAFDALPMVCIFCIYCDFFQMKWRQLKS